MRSVVEIEGVGKIRALVYFQADVAVVVAPKWVTMVWPRTVSPGYCNAGAALGDPEYRVMLEPVNPLWLNFRGVIIVPADQLVRVESANPMAVNLHTCKRCKFSWESVLPNPKTCALCGSPLWRRDRERKPGAGRPRNNRGIQ